MSGVTIEIQGGVRFKSAGQAQRMTGFFICRFWQVHTSPPKRREAIRFTLEPQGSFTNKNNIGEKL
jgi:hypothetical protein